MSGFDEATRRGRAHGTKQREDSQRLRAVLHAEVMRCVPQFEQVAREAAAALKRAKVRPRVVGHGLFLQEWPLRLRPPLAGRPGSERYGLIYLGAAYKRWRLEGTSRSTPLLARLPERGDRSVDLKAWGMHDAETVNPGAMLETSLTGVGVYARGGQLWVSPNGGTFADPTRFADGTVPFREAVEGAIEDLVARRAR